VIEWCLILYAVSGHNFKPVTTICGAPSKEHCETIGNGENLSQFDIQSEVVSIPRIIFTCRPRLRPPGAE
jgi:hypothetical protein